MRTIWKYPLLGSKMTILLPFNAKPLYVAYQNNSGNLWVELYTEEQKVERHFEIFGTGQEISKSGILKYIGSYMEGGGLYVWHVYEQLQP